MSNKRSMRLYILQILELSTWTPGFTDCFIFNYKCALVFEYLLLSTYI